MEVMSMHVHVLCTCVEYLRIFLYVTYIQYHIDIIKNYGSTKVQRTSFRTNYVSAQRTFVLRKKYFIYYRIKR